MSADLFANCNAGNPGNSRWDAGEGPGMSLIWSTFWRNHLRGHPLKVAS